MTRREAIMVIAAIALIGGFLVGRQYRLMYLAPFGPPPADITEFLPEDSVPAGSLTETGMPLDLPPGFSISVFAKDLPGARVMRFDRSGNLWVSRTSEGAVTLLEIDGDTGAVRNQGDVFRGLQKPHGLAFDPEQGLRLYIAEEHRIRRFQTYSEDATGVHVLDLPQGEGHFTRTIDFGPDRKLYISVGSSCNVCQESDQRRAAILRYDPETKQSEIFARGLRNAVFFIWDSAGRMWATEMGRDWLGDDLPPDEINIVEEGKHYGWPLCYGKNIQDTDFDPLREELLLTPVKNPRCISRAPSFIDIPAHSAPLGLGFVPPNSRWPEDYWHDLLVAYHGSWNRSQPTGYKVVRHRFDTSGRYEGVQDFITGWLTPEGALGRPVDIILRDGSIYLSDDKAGVIYKVEWRRT